MRVTALWLTIIQSAFIPQYQPGLLMWEVGMGGRYTTKKSLPKMYGLHLLSKIQKCFQQEKKLSSV